MSSHSKNSYYHDLHDTYVKVYTDSGDSFIGRLIHDDHETLALRPSLITENHPLLVNGEMKSVTRGYLETKKPKVINTSKVKTVEPVRKNFVEELISELELVASSYQSRAS